MVFLFNTEKNAKIAKCCVRSYQQGFQTSKLLAIFVQFSNNRGIRNCNATSRSNARKYEQVDSLLKKREEIWGESHLAITCGIVLLETILLFCRQ